MRWRYELNRSQARSDYYEPPPVLRNSVVRTIDHPVLFVFGVMEILFFENRHEFFEYVVALEFRDVLHTDYVWLQLLDKTAKILEQRPFRIVIVIETLRVFRKRLTGRATDKDFHMPFGIMAGKVAGLEIGDAFGMEFCSGIVVFIRVLTHLINVVASNDIHTSIQEAACQPTRSTEEVNRCRGHFRRFWHFTFAFFYG